MKNLFALALTALLLVGINGVNAQEITTKNSFIQVDVKMFDMYSPYTKILIVEGYEEIDTIQTMHVNDHKVSLPPLSTNKNYTIVFMHDNKMKSLYIVGSNYNSNETAQVDIKIYWNFYSEVVGSIEYNEDKEKFKHYSSSALRQR